MSVAARRGKHNRSRAGYFAYFSDPANATRTAVSFVAEIVREIVQSLRTRFRRERPRVKRGGLYPVIRAFATVVERDVVVAAVIGDLLAGRTAIYADLVAYDEVAHHSGPAHPDALQVLRSLDRALALIARAARHAPRPYRIVVLSDHGQSHGPTFLERYGLSLGDLVRAGCGLPVPRRAGRTPSGAEARAAARAALHRPEETAGRRQERTAGPGSSHPLVLASGNLGLVSFPDVPGRITREELDRRHPALLATLANHPGIGFLLVRPRCTARWCSAWPVPSTVSTPDTSSAPTRWRRSATARPTRYAVPTASRMSPTSWSTPPATRRTARYTPSRSRSARTAGWAAPRATPSCCGPPS